MKLHDDHIFWEGRVVSKIEEARKVLEEIIVAIDCLEVCRGSEGWLYHRHNHRAKVEHLQKMHRFDAR